MDLLKLVRLAAWLLLFGLLPLAASAEGIATPDGEEIALAISPAQGERLFIWFSSEAGPQPAEAALADQLAATGVEVWRVDLLATRFMPLSDSGFLQVPAGDVAALLSQAAATTRKRIFLLAHGRSAVPLLRGVQAWQQTATDPARLGGVILLSPKLFVETPEPGQAGELLPIVGASNVPLYWLQPRLSPWYWQKGRILAALEQGGSDVFLRTLPGVRDRFFFRPDATAAEDTLRERLPGLLLSAARSLTALPAKTRQPGSAFVPRSGSALQGKRPNVLRPYQAEPTPPPLRLVDLAGRAVDLRDYRGKVVLVNFWASWCPPCVHEMPSMQRLADRLADRPFEILAVNMAEPPAQVRAFLQEKVRVRFPVLLDSDGAALSQWRVFAFPTSFVVDREGRIRYALFGATEWDAEETLAKIRALLDE